MQLDIFDHSRDVMLRNDVVEAIVGQDADAARAGRQALAAEYPDDEALAELGLLIEATARCPGGAITDHEALCMARRELRETVEPAARRRLGDPGWRAWSANLWRDLARRAGPLGFDPKHPDDHAAALWLRVGDGRSAAAAVAGIESWRRIPAPLAWMAEARCRSQGLDPAWPLLAELAWMSPGRLSEVVKRIDDPLLTRLKRQFDASFEDAVDDVPDHNTASLERSDSAQGATDLPWFPAWLLTEKPALAPLLAQAQPGAQTAGERGLRLMVELLGLEQQGRQREVVERRRSLRDLHAGLYRAYLAHR